jgi:hypothetical protein
MKITFHEQRARIAFLAQDLTKVVTDDATMKVLHEIRSSIEGQLSQIPNPSTASLIEAIFGKNPPGPGIEIDLEPGQWRICKDSLLAAQLLRSVVMTISVALERDASA